MDSKDLRKLFRAATGGRHGGDKDEYRRYGEANLGNASTGAGTLIGPTVATPAARAAA